DRVSSSFRLPPRVCRFSWACRPCSPAQSYTSVTPWAGTCVPGIRHVRSGDCPRRQRVLPPQSNRKEARMARLQALALVCTLKKSSAENTSSSELLARQVLEQLGEHDVHGEVVRVVDYDVRPGVTADEGDGDQWPQLR